jgi:RecJ-like exonuclease
MSDGHRWAGELYLTPLEEMVRRIELARLETADPICPTCDSRVTITQTRACYVCGETKAIESFPRQKKERLGRGYICKSCKRAQSKPLDAARHHRHKRQQFRAILGEVAS